MPLFFLMSGLFFKPGKGINVKRLLVPYCFFYIVAFGKYIVKAMLTHQEVDWCNFFVPLLGGTSHYQNTPIWFLLALLEIMVLSFPIVRWLNRTQGMVIGALLGIVGYWLGSTSVHMPYYIDVALLNIVFFLFAYYYRQVILDRLNGYTGFPLLVLSIIVYILFPGFTNVSQNAVPMGVVPFYMISLTASLGIVGVMKSTYGKAGNVLGYLGENSLIIMCTHMMLLGISSFCHAHIGNVWAANFIGLAFIMVIELPICLAFNKYGRVLIGK